MDPVDSVKPEDIVEVEKTYFQQGPNMLHIMTNKNKSTVSNYVQLFSVIKAAFYFCATFLKAAYELSGESGVTETRVNPSLFLPVVDEVLR